LRIKPENEVYVRAFNKIVTENLEEITGLIIIFMEDFSNSAYLFLSCPAYTNA
jgi:hypothetical protein